MSGAKVRLAVFDCDGTLVDGQHEICAAMEHAFAARGLPAPPRQAVRHIVGLSLGQAMRRLLPEGPAKLQAALVEEYKQAYRAARARATASGHLIEPLFPGIRELLDALRGDGWRWAWPPANRSAGWSIALPCMGFPAISSRCKPLISTRPSRIPRCWKRRWRKPWPPRPRR